MNFTCKGCELRHPGCHATCEKYKQEKQIHEERMAIERKKRDTNNGLYSQQEQKIYNAIRRKKNAKKYFTKG